MEILPFLILPFLASLILTGIHSYLGVHVASVASFSWTLPCANRRARRRRRHYRRDGPHGRGAYWISLGFTFSAPPFSRLRAPAVATFPGGLHRHRLCRGLRDGHSPDEQGHRRDEHLKDMLVGNILAVSRPEVIKTALLYSAIGLFHFIFRKKFLLISMNHNKAEQSGLSVRFWDFLFYASFGFVVHFVGGHCGRSARFCYLIVPSVGAMLFADRIGPRLAIGWTMGTLVSALGVYLSVQLDTPTGATIVVTFGGVLIVMFLVHLVLHHGRSARELQGGVSAQRELEAATPSSREA